jgi:hypothetical protein
LVNGLAIKEETTMNKISKIMALAALIGFVFGTGLICNAVAGEKVKLRNVWYGEKWEQFKTGYEEGHVVAISDGKFITTIMEGNALPDGMAGSGVSFWDLNTKTGIGAMNGYGVNTAKDGDKIYYTWEGKNDGKGWKGLVTIAKGSGKYEGIKGKGTWVYHPVKTPMMYVDLEVDVELPEH